MGRKEEEVKTGERGKDGGGKEKKLGERMKGEEEQRGESMEGEEEEYRKRSKEKRL